MLGAIGFSIRTITIDRTESTGTLGAASITPLSICLSNDAFVSLNESDSKRCRRSQPPQSRKLRRAEQCLWRGPRPAATFGQPTLAFDPRQFQFGLRISF